MKVAPVNPEVEVAEVKEGRSSTMFSEYSYQYFVKIEFSYKSIVNMR